MQPCPGGPPLLNMSSRDFVGQPCIRWPSVGQHPNIQFTDRQRMQDPHTTSQMAVHTTTVAMQRAQLSVGDSVRVRGSASDVASSAYIALQVCSNFPHTCNAVYDM